MEENTSRLLQRYKDAIKNGKEPYFDINELEELLEHFETEEEFTYFKKLAALGRKLHPDNVIMKIQEARGCMFFEHYNKALTLLDAIDDGEVVDKADESEIDILKTECRCRMGQYDKAMKHIDELIKGKCYYLQEMFETIATTLVDICMDDEAFKFINRGMKLFPNSVFLRNELDRLMDCVDADKAIELQNKQIDKDPYDADNWNTAAQIYADKGDFGKAIEALCFASACDDEEPDTEMEMMKGFYCYMNGNYEKAIEVYKKINVTPDMKEESEEICSVMAKCYMELENYEEAYKCLKKTIGSGIESDSPRDYLNFIHCCMETEHDEDIPEVLDVVNKKFPQDTHVLSTLAAAYWNFGKEKDSKEAAERLLKIIGENKYVSQEDAENLFSIGEFFYMVDDVDEALKFFNAVYKVKPDYPFIHIHLALAYLLKGDMRHFEEHYKPNSIEEFRECMTKKGFDADELMRTMDEAVAEARRQHAALPDELVDEFLRNKGNKN